MSESITKPNTIETFMKANTDLRISADTIKEFQTQIDVIAASITKESEKQAKAAGRSTIMPADIKQPYQIYPVQQPTFQPFSNNSKN